MIRYLAIMQLPFIIKKCLLISRETSFKQKRFYHFTYLIDAFPFEYCQVLFAPVSFNVILIKNPEKFTGNVHIKKYSTHNAKKCKFTYRYNFAFVQSRARSLQKIFTKFEKIPKVVLLF